MTVILQAIRAAVSHHPKRVAAMVALVLLGTGVTAVAVVPLPDPLDHLPLRHVVEPVEPTKVTRSTAFDAPVPWVLYRTDYTLRADTIQTLFQRLGIADPSAMTFMRRHSVAASVLQGRPGKLITAHTNEHNELLSLTARWVANDTDTVFQRITIERADDGFEAGQDTGEFTASVRLTSGTIRSSLFAATDAANLPDSVASQLADLFAGDIDFRRDLRQGDTFSVVYEALEADGEHLKFGRMLSAQFVNKGRTFSAMWFQEDGKRGAYYTLEGESMRRAFLSSPLAFSRVSSGYGMRFHPVHGNRRPHLGVDYAAPTGTPVRTVADGVVQFAGRQGGFGNVVFVRHRDRKVTVYAHLSRIHVRTGQRIEQSDLIGLVGCTGVCTGPHLHFEYRVNGVHKNPLLLAREKAGEPISAQYRGAFQAASTQMRTHLTAASSMVLSSAR